MLWLKREYEMKVLSNLVIGVALIFCFIATYNYVFWILLFQEFILDILSNDLGLKFYELFELFYIIETLLPLILTIFLIIWLKRAHYYLSERVVGLEYDSKYIIFNWVIPILNIYKPYFMIKEVFNETRAY